MGLKTSRCGFSSPNLFWALTWAWEVHRQLVAGTLPASTPPPVLQHQLLAPRHPAWPPECCRHPSILDWAARLHDLRHPFHDRCTAFPRRFRDVHRHVLNLIGCRWQWDRYWRSGSSGAAPERSFSQPKLHDVSLVDVQTSGLPKYFRLVLTSSNTTRMSFAVNSFVRTLCMPLSVPT